MTSASGGEEGDQEEEEEGNSREEEDGGKGEGESDEAYITNWKGREKTLARLFKHV